MLKKPIQKENRNVFHNFMKEKSELAQLVISNFIPLFKKPQLFQKEKSRATQKDFIGS